MSGEQKLLWLFAVILGLGLIFEVIIWVKKLFIMLTGSEVLCDNETNDG